MHQLEHGTGRKAQKIRLKSLRTVFVEFASQRIEIRDVKLLHRFQILCPQRNMRDAGAPAVVADDYIKYHGSQCAGNGVGGDDHRVLKQNAVQQPANYPTEKHRVGCQRQICR